MRIFDTGRVLALAVAGTLAAPALAQDAQTMPANPTTAQGQPSMPTGQPGMMQEPQAGTTTSTATTSTTTGSTPTDSTMGTDTATSPDGSKLFGFEPYFGVLGGYHSFDRKPGFIGANGARFDGALIEGVLGANLPLGPLFVGVEGHAAKGFGDIEWEYGVRGRAGARIGESGLIYGSVGYAWIDPKENRGFGFVNTGDGDGVTINGRRKDWVYGMGVEIGPRDIGLGGVTGESGIRFRLSAETYDGKSIRPMGGVIFHF